MKTTNTLFATLFTLLLSIAALATAPINDNFANAFALGSTIPAHIASSNVGATKEPGEQNHAGNAGGQSVWFSWTAPISRNMLITTNRSANNMDTLLHIYEGTSLGNLQSAYSNNNIDAPTNLRSFVVLNAVAGTTYYIAIDGNNDGVTTAQGVFYLDIQPYFKYQGADFDNDGMTDLSLFRPSTGDWLVNGTTRSFTERWGANGDIPVIAGRSAYPGLTTFRSMDGTWYYHTLSDNNIFEQWGTNGDIPVADDFSGFLSNFTVFRPSTGTWYIKGTGSNPNKYYQFGQSGDIPVPGQYSPDAYADVAVFRPSNGTWYFVRRIGIDVLDTFRQVQFGQQGDKPVPADYDGDGLLDVAVYRPSTGTWWVLQSSNNQTIAFRWGIAEDLPTTGDFDGDGKFDYAVFRPSTATWYVYRSGDNQMLIKQFGQTGDIPITANRSY